MSALRCLGHAVLGMAAFLELSPAASASDLVGTVVFSGRPAAHVVISIEELKQREPSGAKVYVIDHHDLNFVPHVLVVPEGATVEFKNSDGMPCVIYSVSPTGMFVLRRQDGKPMTVTFSRSGVVEIRCSEHRRIYAYVVVKENPFFALTDSQGKYKISGVPPGRHTLLAWYEGKEIERKSIEVGSKKLTVDFQASRPEPEPRAAQLPDGDSVPAGRFIGFLSSDPLEVIR